METLKAILTLILSIFLILICGLGLAGGWIYIMRLWGW